MASRSHNPPLPHSRKPPRAFTLFELTLVLLILGIVAAALVPVIGNNIRSPRLRTAANVLAADIEFCASTCISRPGNPAAISFQPAENKYSLIDISSGSTLKHPSDGRNFINDFSSGRNSEFADVTIKSVTSGGNPVTALTFDSYGKPVLTSNLVITLAFKMQTLTLTVDASTGDVTISG